jgi:membrane protease YdiL (CAAX protease family)
VVKHYKHPLLFYVLATAIPWGFWYFAGKASHSNPPDATLVTVPGFAGLLAPLLIALWLMHRDSLLGRDLFSRMFNFGQIGPGYLLLACVLMPGSILLAQAISLLFGYSASQFVITGHYTFSSGVFPVWFLLIAAPVIEELAWHTYGTDCLRSRFNLFTTSLVFAVFRGLWHIPLGNIKDYYQSHLVEAGAIHAVNFLVSIFPFVFIMNWLYYKTGRNILVPVVFHITAGYFNEIFATHPDSKVIQTGILIVVASVIVLRDKPFFFNRHPEPG